MRRRWFEWTLATRLLREGRTQTLLIITGIAVGVAVIVFLTALIGGLQRQIIERTLGTQAHIRISAPEDVARPLREEGEAVLLSRIDQRAQRLRSVDQWQRLEQALAEFPEVTAISPLVSGPALARRGEASRAVVLMGIDPERYTRIVPVPDFLVEGRWRIVGNDIAIGRQLAEDLGARLGDRLRLDTGEGRSEVFTVVAVFELGARDLDARFVYMAMKPAQGLLGLPGGATSIDLRVREIFAAEAVAQRIAGRLGIRAESWMTLNSNILDALAAQSMSTNLIKVFVGLSVAFAIASVLAVSVVQRGREIGILRAMGTSPRRIMTVFLLQGGIYGLVGSVAGSGLAFGLLAFFSRVYRNADGSALFAAELDPMVALRVCGLAVVIGLLAAALPARRAARMDPVQAIRM